MSEFSLNFIKLPAKAKPNEIKKIFKAFPGIKIHSITDIGEALDETKVQTNIINEKEL